jgi:hypothetical protein
MMPSISAKMPFTTPERMLPTVSRPIKSAIPTLFDQGQAGRKFVQSPEAHPDSRRNPPALVPAMGIHEIKFQGGACIHHQHGAFAFEGMRGHGHTNPVDAQGGGAVVVVPNGHGHQGADFEHLCGAEPGKHAEEFLRHDILPNAAQSQILQARPDFGEAGMVFEGGGDVIVGKNKDFGQFPLFEEPEFDACIAYVGGDDHKMKAISLMPK